MTELMGGATGYEKEGSTDPEVYVKIINEYKWVGPLSRLSSIYYSIYLSNKSKKTKRNIDSYFKNYMIFASDKPHFDLYSIRHNGFIYENSKQPIAEYFYFWRPIVGNITLPPISPEPGIKVILKKIVGYN